MPDEAPAKQMLIHETLTRCWMQQLFNPSIQPFTQPTSWRPSFSFQFYIRNNKKKKKAHTKQHIRDKFIYLAVFFVFKVDKISNIK